LYEDETLDVVDDGGVTLAEVLKSEGDPDVLPAAVGNARRQARQRWQSWEPGICNLQNHLMP
jgi:hypothetical protein